MLGRLLGWHGEATSHPPSSPSSSPREEAMQMEMRNKYSCLLRATADVFQNVWLGPRNQTHPGKEALSRRKRGDRVAYLSMSVSFLGGRAHGSSLAALLRWGCGKCTVTLARRMAGENGSRIKGRHARLHRRHTSVLGPGIHSCFPHLLPTYLVYRLPLTPAPLTTAPTLSPLFHSWEVNTTGLPASFKGPLQFRQELRMHVWRDILATSKFSSPSLILESWQNGGCK